MLVARIDEPRLSQFKKLFVALATSTSILPQFSYSRPLPALYRAFGFRMHAVVWPTLRAASKSRYPARLIKRRRYSHLSRIRSYHSTPSLAQSSNPPPHSDNIPIQHDDLNKNTDERKATAEQPDVEPTTEDPDVLAKKLQRSKEMVRRYNSALKRSQRR